VTWRRQSGAADLDQSERRMMPVRDELLDLGDAAGDLEDEMLGVGVDHLGAEGIGQTQGLDPVVAAPDTLIRASSRSSGLSWPSSAERTVRSTTRCTGTMRSS
jgi:hypothetical protein